MSKYYRVRWCRERGRKKNNSSNNNNNDRCRHLGCSFPFKSPLQPPSVCLEIWFLDLVLLIRRCVINGSLYVELSKQKWRPLNEQLKDIRERIFFLDAPIFHLDSRISRSIRSLWRNPNGLDPKFTSPNIHKLAEPKMSSLLLVPPSTGNVKAN